MTELEKYRQMRDENMQDYNTGSELAKYRQLVEKNDNPGKFYAKRIIASTVKDGDDYNILRQTDWDGAIKRYGEASGEDLSGSAAQIKSAINSHLKQYSPANTDNKWVAAARENLKNMQLPGYEYTDHGTSFDDYERAYDRGVRGDELTKIYNAALSQMNGAAQEAYTQERLRKLTEYLDNIKRNGFDEEKTDEYKKSITASDAFSAQEADEVIDLARKNNSMPYLTQEEYDQGKSKYELALQKMRQAQQDYADTQDHHYKSDIEKAKDEAAKIYAEEVAPYELKGVSRRDIDDIAADYKAFADADGDDEADVMRRGLELLYSRARTEGDIDADFEAAQKRMQQAQENVDEWYRVYSGHASDPHLSGVSVRFDGLEEYEKELEQAKADYLRFSDEQAKTDADILLQKIDADNDLTFDQLSGYLNSDVSDYAPATILTALAHKIQTQDDADKAIALAKEYKKSAPVDADKDSIDKMILSFQNIKADIPLLKYEGLEDNDDFDRVVFAVKNTVNKRNSEYDYWSKAQGQTSSYGGVVDKSGKYQADWFDDPKNAAIWLRVNGNDTLLSYDRVTKSYYDRYAYETLPDFVRNKFNYIWETDGENAAVEYINTYMNSATGKKNKVEKSLQIERDYASKHPVMSSIDSVFINLSSGAGVIDSVGSYISGTPIDIYSENQYGSQLFSAVHGQVSDDLRKNYGDAAAFVYETGMSAINSAVNVAVSTALFSPFGSAVGLSASTTRRLISASTSLIMSSQAATSAVIEGKKKGYDDGKALGVGLARGAAEALSEYFSIEKIQSATGSFWRKMAQSFAAEGTEEVASNWLNRAIDLVACQDESEILKLQNAKNWDEVADVLAGMLGDDLLSFLGGGISGMAMGSVHSLSTYADYSSVGSEISSTELANLQKYAMNSDLSSMTKAKSNYAKGQLYYAVQGDVYDKLAADSVDELNAAFDSLKSRDNPTVNRIARQVYETKLAKFGDTQIGAYIIKNNAQAGLIYSGMQSTDEHIKALAQKAAENRTEKNIGKLYSAMNAASDVRSVVQEAARHSAEIENAPDPDAMASAVTKKFFGQRLSRAQAKLMSSKTGQKVFESAVAIGSARIQENVNTKQAAQRSVGGTTLKNAPVTVNGVKTSVVKLTDGEHVLTNDNKVVPLAAVQFEDSTDAQLWQYAARHYAESDAASQAFVHGYSLYTKDKSGTVPVEDYARAFRQYYDLGKVRTPKDVVIKTIGNEDISTGAASMAYAAGVDESFKQFKTPGAYYFFNTVDSQKEFLDANRAVIPALEQIAKECGVSFVYTDKMDSGTRGSFDERDDVIFINAKANGGIVTITAGHELFHFIEKYNKKDAAVLRETIINKLKQTGTYETVYNQVASAYTGSHTDIETEIAADSMFDVFHNVKEIADMIDRTDVSEGFWDKMFSEIQRFVKAAKKAVSGMRDADVSSLRDDVQFLSDVRDKFNAALKQAAENKRIDKDSRTMYNESVHLSKKYKTKFFHDNTFPPYNESFSDANEQAIRWARRDDVHNGYQNLLSYHGNWYVVECFDDMPLGYQITEKVKKSDYNKKRLEIQEYERLTKGEPAVRTIDEVDWVDHVGNKHGREGRGIIDDAVGYGGQSSRVRQLDQNEDRRRQADGDSYGDLRSGVDDKQGETTSDIKYSREFAESIGQKFSKEINETVDKALINKGDIGEKYNQKRISSVPGYLADMVYSASDGAIDISNKFIAINGSDIYHEFNRHSNEKELSRDQVPLSTDDLKNAIKYIYDPDIVESIFTDGNNPSQRQSFAYAKKDGGYYVIVEAVGGKRNPNIVPVMIIRVTEHKWDSWIGSGRTIGEMLYENDPEYKNALDVRKNKKNRVTAAQFVSDETIAKYSAFSSVNNDSIPQNAESVNTQYMQDSQNNVSDSDGIKYSRAYAVDDEGKSIRDQLIENADRLNEMDSVMTVETEFMFKNAKAAKSWILDNLRSTGFQVDRQGFGKIVFNEKLIRSSLTYMSTIEEYAAYAAIPRVLKRGIQLGEHKNHKNRGYSTVTFGAPVIINGQRGNMGVVVKITNANKYKMHRIIMPDGAQMVFDENERSTPGTSGASRISGVVDPTTGTASANSIPQNDIKSQGGIKESRAYNVDKPRKSSYNEFNTYAMMWANATKTPQGAQKCIYNPRTDEWCIIVADKNIPGGFGVVEYFRTYDEAENWLDRRYGNVESDRRERGYRGYRSPEGYGSNSVYSERDYGDDGYGEIAENEEVADGESGSDAGRNRTGGDQYRAGSGMKESREVVKYYSREQAKRFIQENDLDGLLDYIEKDSKLIRERIADWNSVKKVAREIVEESNSTYNLNLFTDQLQALYNELLNEDMTDEDFIAQAVTLIRSVYDQAENLKTEFPEGEYFLEKHRGETFAISSLADTGYETFGALNEAFGGAIRFVQADGRSQHADNSLDKNWDLLVDDSSGVLDRQTNEGDQVRALKSFIDTINESKYASSLDEYLGEDIEKYSQWRAVDLLAKFADIPQAKTYAQRIADKHKQQIEYLRKAFKIEKKEIRESARVRYRDMKERNKIRRSMNKALADMQRKYDKPKKSGYVAEAYRDTYGAVLDLAKARVYRDYDMEKLKHLCGEVSDKVDGLKTNATDDIVGWCDYAHNVLSELKSHVDPNAKTFAYEDKFKDGQYSGRGSTLGAVLTVKDLNALNDVIQGLKHIESNAQKMIINGRMQSVAEVSRGIADHLSNTRKKRILANRSAVSSMGGFMNVSFVTPVYFFDSLGDYGKQLFKQLSDAQANVYMDIDVGKRFMDSLMERENKKTFYETHTFDLESGQQVKLSTQQLMTIYLMSKREAAKGRIQNILIEKTGHGRKKTLETESLSVTENDITAFKEALSEQQIFVADKIQRFFAEVAAKWGNEASMRMYGFEMFKDDTYVPLITDSREHVSHDSTEDNAGFYTVANYGFTKQVNRESLPTFRIGNLFDVFADHTMKMAMYHNMAPVLNELAAVYNYNKDGLNMKTVLENYLSGRDKVNGRTYLETLMEDLNNANKYDGADDLELFSRITSRAKKSMVAGNLWVAGKQFTSYFRALNVLSAEALKEGFTVHPLKSLEEAKRYNGLAVRKSEYGGFTTGVSPEIKDVMLSSTMVGMESASHKADSALSFLAEKADDITWGALWKACKEQVKIDNEGIDTVSDEFFALVSDKFSDVINRTQVIDTPLNRSLIRRSNSSAVQTLTMFADEAILSYNIARNAITNGGTKKQRAKAIALFVTSHILSQAFVSMLDAIRTTIRDEDREEALDGFIQNYMSAFAANIRVVGNLPAYSMVLNLVEGYETQAQEYETLNQFAQTVLIWGKFLVGKDVDIEKSLRYTANALARITGIPFLTWYKDIVGTVDTVRIACGQLPLFEKLSAKRVRNALEKGYETKAKEYAKELVKQKMQDDPEKSEKDAKADVRQSLYNAYNEKYIEAYEKNNRAEMEKIRAQLMRLDIGYTPDTFSDWIKKYEEKKKQGR